MRDQRTREPVEEDGQIDYAIMLLLIECEIAEA